MNEQEAALAEELYEAIQVGQMTSPRSVQAAEFRVGISDLGYCSERLRRTLAKQVPQRTDWLAAFAGHALGNYMEQAAKQLWPEAITQAEVYVDLTSDDNEHVYRIFGHPDLIHPKGLVIDFKTDRGLQVVRRTGASRQQKFQRNLYAVGAVNAGLFGDDVNLDDVQVANVWMDRACDEKELHVEMTAYEPATVVEAAEWLDEVVYCWKHDQEARKEPPREVCEVTCGFFADCRGRETDVTGLITDPTMIASAAMYDEGLAMEREAKQLKDQAKAHLVGVKGSTGQHSIRWITIEGGEVAYTRRPSERLQVKRIK